MTANPASAGTAEGWDLFPHDADLGVRGHGPTLEAAFVQAALGLTAAITDKPIEPAGEVTVICTAPDRELLFAEWLNAVIYEMATRDMLFARYAVTIEGNSLKGRLWGEPVDQARHQPGCEPKGATYTELHVAEAPDGSWSAQCVVDV